MPSQIIGRTTCPECGFGSAHVKRSERCAYRYCPECGAQYMATGERREADLLAKTRLNAPGSPPTPSGAPPAPIPADPATPPAPTTGSDPTAPQPKRRPRLFG